VDTKLNPFIFRAYDIRGVVGTDLTPQVARLVGQGVGTFLVQKFGGNRIVIGRDNRLSSEDLKNGVVSGLLAIGCEVIDIGLSTSPMLYAAVIDLKATGGVNVTGSHNPVDYNGFKVVGQEAYPVSEDEIQVIKGIIEQRQMTVGGKGINIPLDVTSGYIRRIVQNTKLHRPIRVVVDTGNGVAGKYLPTVLREFGCDVIELHCDLDGRFPNHLPNPENAESMIHLGERVVEEGAELGIATDGDGDRIGLVDEHGQRRPSDEIIILLARDFLLRHPGSRVLVDVKISKKVLQDIEQSGGKPFLWKTGHSLIKMKMREEGILLGGELSGHMFVFENYLPIDDAIFAASRLLQILSSGERSISQHLEGLPTYCTTNLIEVPASDSTKFGIVRKVVETFSKDYKVIDIDGARVDFGSGWAVIRASNTTPNLTLRFEADTPSDLDIVRARVYEVLRGFPDVDLSQLHE
jgi:phosphomannomutase / phosphoglucomutase